MWESVYVCVCAQVYEVGHHYIYINKTNFSYICGYCSDMRSTQGVESGDITDTKCFFFVQKRVCHHHHHPVKQNQKYAKHNQRGYLQTQHTIKTCVFQCFYTHTHSHLRKYKKKPLKKIQKKNQENVAGATRMSFLFLFKNILVPNSSSKNKYFLYYMVFIVCKYMGWGVSLYEYHSKFYLGLGFNTIILQNIYIYI